jgi:hypothetical protein
MAAPRKYPDELRERAVREVRSTSRPIAYVAKDLGIHKEALRGWVRQAEADRGERASRRRRRPGRPPAFGRLMRPSYAHHSLVRCPLLPLPTSKYTGLGSVPSARTAPMMPSWDSPYCSALHRS